MGTEGQRDLFNDNFTPISSKNEIVCKQLFQDNVKMEISISLSDQRFKTKTLRLLCNFHL